jgi:osmotically-inducible protein OsmY
MRIRTFVLGGLAGAAVAYLFDPIGGRGRRARLLDQVRSMTGRGGGMLGDGADVVLELEETEVVVGMSAPQERPDDQTLADRIHSTVFGEPDVPDDRLTLEVVDGIVTLRGELDSQEEIDDIAGRIAAVPDVREVDVLVHLPGEPAPNKEAAIQASRDAEADLAQGRSEPGSER